MIGEIGRDRWIVGDVMPFYTDFPAAWKAASDVERRAVEDRHGPRGQEDDCLNIPAQAELGGGTLQTRIDLIACPFPGATIA